MGFTKRNIIKTAALGSALIGAVAIAAPASAEDFGPTDYGTLNNALVSYNDQNDDFCVRAIHRDGVTFKVAPYDTSRGPDFEIYVPNGEVKCVGLQKAYEDSDYYYQITAGGGGFFKFKGDTGPTVHFTS